MTRFRSCGDCRTEFGRGDPRVQPYNADNAAGRCDRHDELAAARAAACVDCLDEGREPAKCRPVDPRQPGRRCVTHGRAATKARKLAAHGKRIESNFEISAEDYWRLYEAQGGKCAGCQRATGKAKRLAVDHDHTCDRGHLPNVGCRYCIRALLCGHCNQELGRLGVATMRRLIHVFYDRPAQKILNPEQEQ